MSRGAEVVGAALIGAVFCAIGVGPYRINPLNYDWLLSGDQAQELFAWWFVRQEPWSWPLGKLATFPEGIPSSLAYTDGIPIYSLAWKLVGSWLPDFFQILGPWLLLSFSLQAVFSYLVFRTLGAERRLAYLGAALLVAAPVLLFRVGHISLCAHWLILAAFWLALRDRRLPTAILIFVASGIHPYLFAMIFVLCIARPLRVQEYVLFSFVGIGGLYAFHYFAEQSPRVRGFNWYSADVLTFFNSMGTSRFVRGFPTSGGQFEGFGYLGVGVFCLVPFVGRQLFSLPRARSVQCLLAAAVLLFVFSWGGKVRLAGQWVLDLTSPYETLLAPISSTFRGSGRFVWPLYYLTVVGVAWRFMKRISSRPQLVWMLIALVSLQWVETLTAFAGYSIPQHPVLAALSAPPFDGLGRRFRSVHLVPPYIHDARCEDRYPDHFYVPFALLAYREHMAINSGTLSRQTIDATRIFCERSRADILNGNLRRDAVYFVADFATELRAALERYARCRQVDSLVVCAARRPKSSS